MEEVMSVQSGVRNYASVPELGYPLYRWPAVESVLEGHAVWGKADGTELVMAPSWRSPWMIRVFSSLGYKQSERKERDSSLASGLISNNKKQIVVLYFFSFFFTWMHCCLWVIRSSFSLLCAVSVCLRRVASVCLSLVWSIYPSCHGLLCNHKGWGWYAPQTAQKAEDSCCISANTRHNWKSIIKKEGADCRKICLGLEVSFCKWVSPGTFYWVCTLWNCWKWVWHPCKAQWEMDNFLQSAFLELCQSPSESRLFAGSPTDADRSRKGREKEQRQLISATELKQHMAS